MTIFDLLFILLFLTSVVTLAFAALLALRGRRPRALRILRRLAIGAVIYLGVVMLVSLVSARRVLHIGEPLCFDDWCITVENVEQTASPSEVVYIVKLRLANQARRAIQRENGLVVYLSDAQGRRYNSIVDTTVVPFNVQLQPLESVITSRRFKVPAGTSVSGLLITHDNQFPIDWFIIGEGPFRPEPIVNFNAQETH